ncbi:hypothetical protein SNEBB_009503 [Seison nebaliae]|nr:hypothetical protein SNEBB_009503 [Seison nebaliae]
MIYEKTLLGRMGKDDEHSLISRWTNQADVDWDDNLIEDLRSPYKSPVVHSLMSTFKYFQVVIHSNDTLKLTLTFPNNEDSTSSSWFHSSNLYQVYGPTDNNTLPLELNNVKINYHIDTFHMLGESNTDRQLAWIETYCGCECDPVMIGIFGTDDICIPYFFYDNPNPSNFSIIYSPGPGPTDRNKFLLAEHLSIVGLT